MNDTDLELCEKIVVDRGNGKPLICYKWIDVVTKFCLKHNIDINDKVAIANKMNQLRSQKK